jgi:glycosyltransferase involved in cell wall biosynthesis
MVASTGYDSNKWQPSNADRENLVITVGAVERSNLRRKGFETSVKAARYLPDVKFALIAKYLDASVYYLKSIASSNLDFTGFVSDTELLRFIREPKCIVSYPHMKVYLILYLKQCCVDVYLSELSIVVYQLQ